MSPAGDYGIRPQTCRVFIWRKDYAENLYHLDKIKPAYDITYKVVLFICKLLLIADIIITTMSVIGRYVPFIPDPAWSEEVVLTCMSYMAVLSAALAIRRGAHIRMTAFDVYLPKMVVKVLDILWPIWLSVSWASSCWWWAGTTPPPWAAAASMSPCPG